MFNIKFKGEYKSEEQLISNSKLYKGGIMFEEESTMTEAFIKGLKFALPILIIMIILFLLMVKINNLKLQYSSIHFVISCFISFPLLYIHELIHALTIPLKDEKSIYINLKEQALFVYSNAIVSKQRFILICLMPTIVLSFIPFVLSMMFINIIPVQFTIDIIYISIFMCLSAVGDFTNAYNTIRQVPKGAKVFNYGFHSY